MERASLAETNLAAKAAGYGRVMEVHSSGKYRLANAAGHPYWDPLGNAQDSEKLRRRVGLRIERGNDAVCVTSRALVKERYSDDISRGYTVEQMAAAERRVIFRAAVQIASC